MVYYQSYCLTRLHGSDQKARAGRLPVNTFPEDRDSEFRRAPTLKEGCGVCDVLTPANPSARFAPISVMDLNMLLRRSELAHVRS
jgi:hypothetical protein